MVKTSIIAYEVEEDRISNLPDDVIRLILSFLDLKYVIQFCTLSRNWKDIWTSIPHVNLNDKMFPFESQFVRFVDHALYYRNNETDVSSLKLTLNELHNRPVVQKILYYAYLHNVEKLTIEWGFRDLSMFLIDPFRYHTLKHLTLAVNDEVLSRIRFPAQDFDFPALETISLSNMHLNDGDFISKYVNLKELTLRKCSMFSWVVFNICAPQLSNLTITDSDCFPEVFNVVAPQLKNLTATVKTTCFGLPKPCDSMRLTSNRFDSLEKVSLFMPRSKERSDVFVSVLLSLFKELHSAKSLVLDVDIIKTLSLNLDKLSHEPCPFDKLKCLRIVKVPTNKKGRTPKTAIQVRNYLLRNSPSATFTMDLLQVPPKISQAAMYKTVGRKKKGQQEYNTILK